MFQLLRMCCCAVSISPLRYSRSSDACSDPRCSFTCCTPASTYLRCSPRYYLRRSLRCYVVSISHQLLVFIRRTSPSFILALSSSVILCLAMSSRFPVASFPRVATRSFVWLPLKSFETSIARMFVLFRLVVDLVWILSMMVQLSFEPVFPYLAVDFPHSFRRSSPPPHRLVTLFTAAS
jgi:hypothetical protein